MFKNSLKITLRHLWRSRLFVMLNIVGLAIGISACWIIYNLVSYEFSFDAPQANSEHIYRVVSRFTKDGKESAYPGAPRPLGNAIRQQIEGVELIVPVYWRSVNLLDVPQTNSAALKLENVTDVVATDSRYFKLIEYEWLAGDPESAINEPGQVVLTRSRASKYFPHKRPAEILGRILTYNGSVNAEVAGVIEDLDYPTDFKGKEFISLSTFPDYRENLSEGWEGVTLGEQLYIVLHPAANKEQIEKQINVLSNKGRRGASKELDQHSGRLHLLQPFSDIHFNSDYGHYNTRIAHKPTLYGLTAIAAFILLLAAINYINLSTARIPARAREIGVLRSLGSSSAHLIARFLGETLLITVLAAGLSWLLTRAFFLRYRDFVPEDMHVYTNTWQMIIFLAGLIVFISLISGLYPAWLLSRFRPQAILRGQPAQAPAGTYSHFTLRRSLIVFQFIVAQAFVVCALIAGQQLKYTLEKDMGFNREAVILVDIPHWEPPTLTGLPYKMYSRDDLDKAPALKQEFGRLSGVAEVSLGSPPTASFPSSGYLTYDGENGAIKRQVLRKYADTNMLPLYDMHLLAGRNLRQSDTVTEYVINEACARAFGFNKPQEAIGEFLSDNNKNAVPIVGVVKDFNHFSFHRKIEPLALMTNPEGLNTFNIKLASKSPADWAGAIEEINLTWSKFYPGEPFDYIFYDDEIASFYASERRMARIINLSTVVAVLISCLGLFGLTTLTAVQRTKEIGIRKVLGASVAGILFLLSKDLIKLILIAIVIASFIAWYTMNRWLQDFAYRIEIEWWMFTLAGLLAVVFALLTVSFQSLKAALANPVKSLRPE